MVPLSLLGSEYGKPGKVHNKRKLAGQAQGLFFLFTSGKPGYHEYQDRSFPLCSFFYHNTCATATSPRPISTATVSPSETSSHPLLTVT